MYVLGCRETIKNTCCAWARGTFPPAPLEHVHLAVAGEGGGLLTTVVSEAAPSNCPGQRHAKLAVKNC